MEKNCNNCWWSSRDTTYLQLYCECLPNHKMKIENTYQTAKKCQSYKPITATKKNEQLTLNL